MENNDHGVGILLHLQMVRKDELAANTPKPDGSDGCHSAFAAKEYAVGGNGLLGCHSGPSC